MSQPMCCALALAVVVGAFTGGVEAQPARCPAGSVRVTMSMMPGTASVERRASVQVVCMPRARFIAMRRGRAWRCSAESPVATARCVAMAIPRAPSR